MLLFVNIFSSQLMEDLFFYFFHQMAKEL